MRKPLPPPGSRAICLGRHSSDKQNPTSADDQIRQGIEYCERNGWIVVGTEKDEARTGRTIVGRSGYYNVMAAAEAGECDVVVVEDITRFARDAADALMSARTLSESDVVICTLGGGVLTGLELAVRAQMAQEESEDKSRRTKRGHRSAALKGQAVGSVAYGYRLLNERDENGIKRARDEVEAKVVLRIYEDLAAGMSTKAICAALNSEGVKPPRGGKLWRPRAFTGNPHTMTGIARNPIYAGKLIYGKTNSKLIASTGQKKVTIGPISEHVITDVPHLQIVPEDLWQAVQEILEERTSLGRNHSRAPRYLFSGLIKCGVCGNSFSMVSRGLGCEGRHQGTGCTNRRRVPREALQDAVLAGLKEKIFQPQILDVYIAEYRRELEKAAAEQADRSISTESSLKDIEREIANTLSVVKAGAASGPAAVLLNEELNRLAARRKQLERQVRRAPAVPSFSFESNAVISRLKAMLDDISAALHGPERDAVRARNIIRSFVTQIRVEPLEPDGKPDGRGNGPVRVTVEGSLTTLLGQASASRQIEGRDSTLASLDLPIVAFRYYIDINDENTVWSKHVYADVAIFSRLLDGAEAGVLRRDLVKALAAVSRGSTPGGPASSDLRARNAITHLLKGGMIRAIGASRARAWVWIDRPIGDDDGMQGRTKAGTPVGSGHGTPPEAHVVIITPATSSPTYDKHR